MSNSSRLKRPEPRFELQEMDFLREMASKYAARLDNAWDVLVIYGQRNTGRPYWNSYVQEIYSCYGWLPENFSGQ